MNHYIHLFMKMLLSMMVVCMFAVSSRAQQHGHSHADLERLETAVSSNLKEKSRLKLLLDLGSAYVERDTSEVAVQQGLIYTLSAILLSKKLQDEVALADAYLLAGQFYKAQGDYKKAAAYGDWSLALFTKQNRQEQTGQAYLLKWRTGALENMDYDQRIPLLLKVVEAFHLSGNKKEEAEAYKELGDLYIIEGDVMQAFIGLRKSLGLFTAIGFQRTNGVYDLLGVAYRKLGDYKAAMECGLKAIAISYQIADTGTALATYYNRLGTTYSKVKDPVRAEASFRKALAIDLRYNDTANIFFISYNIIIEMLSQRRASEALHFISTLKAKYPTLMTKSVIGSGMIMTKIYTSLRQFREGEVYCKSIEAIAAARGVDDDLLPMLYNGIVPFYIAQGNWEKAAAILVRYKKSNEINHSTESWSQYYMLQFRIDSAKGNYLAAIDNYRKSIVLRDSLFNETKSHQVNELNVLYETERKDKDLLLMKRNAELQKTRINHADLLRDITLLILLLLGTILFILLRSYRRKQKNNRLLKEKQEEIEHKNEDLEKLVQEKEWLVKEIHHRVKNNLHMVVGLLASQTEFLRGEEAMRAITESQNRVEAMAIIHQRLYQTKDLSTIDMASYIGDLADHLKYSGIGGNTVIQLDIDPVSFPLSHSVPLGLIVNEAVTNALKYAFDKDQRGVIVISLKASGAFAYTLTIRDNGRGLPPDAGQDDTSSFGTTLMKGLSREISGRFQMVSRSGTWIIIDFDLPLAADDIGQQYKQDELAQ